MPAKTPIPTPPFASRSATFEPLNPSTSAPPHSHSPTPPFPPFRPPIFNLHFSIFNSRFPILNSQSSVLNLPHLCPLSLIPYPSSFILSPSVVPHSSISNLQSQLPSGRTPTPAGGPEKKPPAIPEASKRKGAPRDNVSGAVASRTATTASRATCSYNECRAPRRRRWGKGSSSRTPLHLRGPVTDPAWLPIFPTGSFSWTLLG